MLTSRESEVLRLSMGGLPELLGVVTLGEAVQEFHYCPRTIVGYCACGYVAAQQYERQWVLRRSSLISFLRRRENRSQSRCAG